MKCWRGWRQFLSEKRVWGFGDRLNSLEIHPVGGAEFRGYAACSRNWPEIVSLKMRVALALRGFESLAGGLEIGLEAQGFGKMRDGFVEAAGAG